MEEWVEAHDVIIDPPNNRLKIMNPQSGRLNDSFFECLRKAEAETGLTKTIVYARKRDLDVFFERGFHQEAKIDGYFNGQNAYLLAKYQSEERGRSELLEEQDEIVQLALRKNGQATRKSLPSSMILREGRPEDAEQMAALLKTVFQTYPTPVHDPAYLRKAMEEDTLFQLIEHDGKIVALASAEMVPRLKNVEFSDASTHPDYRGQGLLSHLFFALEDEMKKRDIPYLYTLARAQSAAMNITVSKRGFRYTGRLVKHCDIFTGFQDMNVWVKPLKPTRD